MAQPPKNKPNTGQKPAGKASSEDSYFDEFFADPQPHQLDEADTEQQRQWIPDHLMWETTLGIREDDTIDRAIGSKDIEAQQTSQQTAQTPKRQLSEEERRLLRSEFVDNIPTEAENKAPGQTHRMPPTAGGQTAANRNAPPAHHPQTRRAVQQRAAHQINTTTSSKAPVKTVPPRQSTQPRPQTNNPAPQQHPSVTVRQQSPVAPPPHTHTQPIRKGVAREADLSLVKDFQDEIRQEDVREKLFKLGEKAISALSIAAISFFIGYYIGGKNTTETTTAKVEKPSIEVKATAPKKKTPAVRTPKTKHSQPRRTASQSQTPIKQAAVAHEGQDGQMGSTFEGKEIQLDENGQPMVPASEPGMEATGDTANFLPLPEGIETIPESTTVASSDSPSPAPQPAANTADLQKLLDESLQKFQEKQWEAVIDLSNRILALDPNAVTALTNRAVAYTEIGSYALALNDCDLAIEIDPNNPLAINNRGYVYEKMGDMKNAIQDYETACTLGVDISCKEAERLKQSSTE